MNPIAESSSEEGKNMKTQDDSKPDEFWPCNESDEVLFEQAEQMDQKGRANKDKPKTNLLKTEKSACNFDSAEWGIKIDQERKEQAMEQEVQAQANLMESKLIAEGRLQIEKDTVTRKTSLPILDKVIFL
jgi:hypothetical protein